MYVGMRVCTHLHTYLRMHPYVLTYIYVCVHIFSLKDRVILNFGILVLLVTLMMHLRVLLQFLCRERPSALGMELFHTVRFLEKPACSMFTYS